MSQLNESSYLLGEALQNDRRVVNDWDSDADVGFAEEYDDEITFDHTRPDDRSNSCDELCSTRNMLFASLLALTAGAAIGVSALIYFKEAHALVVIALHLSSLALLALGFCGLLLITYGLFMGMQIASESNNQQDFGIVLTGSEDLDSEYPFSINFP